MSYSAVGALTRMKQVAPPAPVAAPSNVASFGTPLAQRYSPPMATLQPTTSSTSSWQPLPSAPMASRVATPSPPMATVQPTTSSTSSWQPLPSAPMASRMATPSAPMASRMATPSAPMASRMATPSAPGPVLPSFSMPHSRSSMPLVAPPPPVTSYLTPYPWAPLQPAAITQSTQVMVPSAAPAIDSPYVTAIETPDKKKWVLGGLLLLVLGGATVWYVTKKKG